MERFVKGEIIVLEFPFSDLKNYKRRPAIIIKVPKGEDLIICQITSASQNKSTEVIVKDDDFVKGKLKNESFVRIDKITTIKASRIKYKIGSLKKEKIDEIMNKLVSFLRN